MAKNIADKKQSGLSYWLFGAPAKFAVLSLALISGAAILYSIIMGLFIGFNTPPPMTPSVILMLVALAFSGYKLIKWLPAEKLDQRSFVALENGLTMIYFLFALSFGILATTKIPSIVLYVMGLQYHSMILFLLALILLSLVYLYMLGLMIGNFYAIYMRARGMGVPRWKALMTFPFTFLMILMPGYVLPDESKAKQAVQIKSKWYAKVTNWVVSALPNSLVALAVILVFSTLAADLYAIALALVFAVAFAAWLSIMGLKAFRKNIGGAYSTVAASINIAMVVILAVLMLTVATGMHGTYAEPVAMLGL